MSEWRWRHLNDVLLAAIVLVNLYTILLPLYPGIVFWFQQKNTSKVQALEAKVTQTPPAKQPDGRVAENRLIIPSILFDEPIHEGKTIKALRDGLWRLPKSSTPDSGSNTVIAGHRLTYTNPRGVLYNLDKVKVGDTVGVWWNGTARQYTVTEAKVVKPTAIEVEAPTDTETLTIYTCTPLWAPKDRLVVVAKPKEL